MEIGIEQRLPRKEEGKKLPKLFLDYLSVVRSVRSVRSADDCARLSRCSQRCHGGIDHGCTFLRSASIVAIPRRRIPSSSERISRDLAARLQREEKVSTEKSPQIITQIADCSDNRTGWKAAGIETGNNERTNASRRESVELILNAERRGAGIGGSGDNSRSERGDGELRSAPSKML